jgi:integrase
MCTYLAKRGSTYYFRRVIPVELRAALGGKAEFMESLGTKDREQAKRLIPDKTTASEKSLDAARVRTMQQAPQKPAEPLSPRAEAMAARQWENAVESAELTSREIAAQDRRREAAAKIMAFAKRELEGSTAELPASLRPYRYLLDDARQEAKLEAEARGIRKANAKAADENTDAAAASGTKGEPDKGVMLDTDIVDRWAAERKVTQKTKDANAAVAAWFYKAVGRIAVDKITKRDVLGFKDKLIADGQSATNTNVKLARLATLLQWSADNELAPDNVAKGVRVKDTEKGKNKRREFDLASLNAIFASPVFASNARPVQGRGEAAYWLPLLALFTGARLEELAQLRPDDVRESSYPGADGGSVTSWFFHIVDTGDENTDTATQLKNAGSQRVVPVHPELVRLGFLAFVTKAKEAKQARLFPALKPGAYDRLGSKWGEWFSGYLRNVCKVTDTRMVFHSFRHTFKQYARHVGMPEGVQRQIMGHSAGDVADQYGSGQPLHQVVAGMAMYRVPGLVLKAD